MLKKTFIKLVNRVFEVLIKTKWKIYESFLVKNLFLDIYSFFRA